MKTTALKDYTAPILLMNPVNRMIKAFFSELTDHIYSENAFNKQWKSENPQFLIFYCSLCHPE